MWHNFCVIKRFLVAPASRKQSLGFFFVRLGIPTLPVYVIGDCQDIVIDCHRQEPNYSKAEMSKNIVKGIGIRFLSCIGIGIA